MSQSATGLEKVPDQTSMKLVEPVGLFKRIERLHQVIARRAFEMFEGDGGIFGRELDHWFKAEAELLHPVHVQVSESGDTVELRAEVPGFTPKELEVSVEAKHVTISGKRESNEERKEGKTVYKETCSNEILRVVDLPAEVDAARATATLKNGVLNLTAPKAVQARGTTKVEIKAA